MMPVLLAQVDAANTPLVVLGDFNTGDREPPYRALRSRLQDSYRDFPHVTGDREVMWKLYVHPDRQGLGLGRRLLGEVEALVEGDELWLEVVDGNEQAFGFYRAHGFEEVERVAGEPFPDDVWMRKVLR